MKKQLIILAFIFLSCDKIEHTEPIPLEPWQVCIPQGYWDGQITYTIPGIVENYTIPCPHTFRQITDSTISIQWWSAPDTCDTIVCADTLFYTIALRKHNESCGYQDTWFIFNSTGFFRNDSLFEHGQVEYLYYNNKVLRMQSYGQWQSWVKLSE